jgi:diguanylate cyclase (GGDEF)-like protein/PAS domain S-box-containing protein
MRMKSEKKEDDRRLYHEIMENMAEGVFLIRARDGVIVYTNPAIERIFGYARGELAGKHIGVITARTDKSPEEVTQEIIQNFNANGVWQGEVQNLKKDGTTFWCHANVSTFEHPQHGSIWIAIHQDITERKRAEHQARERTKELHGFYSLAELTEREGIALDTLYQELTNILPKSWQYTEIACARIVMGDNEFCTKNFTDSAWKQSAPIKVNGLVVGAIEVGYLEEMPEENEGPFLKEERLLIDNIAQRLGRITERKQAEQKIEHLNAELKRLLADRTVRLESEIIAHSKADSALQESEDRFRIAQDISLDAFTILRCIRDEQGRIVDFVWTYANPAAGRILKQPPEKLVGQRLLEVLPGNLENKVLFERYARIVETGEGDEVELEYRSEGITGWFRNMAVKLGNGVAISFSDITARKRAEDALRESEQKTRAILDLSFEFIGLLTPDGILLEANKTALEFIGANLADVVGKPFWETPWWSHSPETQNQVREAVISAAKGELIQVETTHLAEDGTLHTIDFTLKPVKNELGLIILLIPEGRDITERKRAEGALQTSEKKFRALFEHATDAVTLVSKEGNIVFESPSISRITGYTVEERLNMNSFEVLHPDDREAAQNAFEKLLQIPSSSATMEFRVVHKDGSYRHMDCTATNLLDEPAIRAIVVNFRDITERKQAEEKLKEANKRLEEQLGEIKILRDYLREQAIRDPLTGLYNRLYLYTTMERELARAKRENYSVSVMMIDIDHFKAFNDTYGHQAGDEILVALSNLLHRSTRQGDIACRYGGEEFIIIMPGACKVDAQKRAEAIRHDFSNLRIIHDGTDLSAAISIGLAFYPQHGNDMNQITKAADSALYEAKQAGRNRVHVWHGN